MASARWQLTRRQVLTNAIESCDVREKLYVLAREKEIIATGAGEAPSNCVLIQSRVFSMQRTSVYKKS